MTRTTTLAGAAAAALLLAATTSASAAQDNVLGVCDFALEHATQLATANVENSKRQSLTPEQETLMTAAKSCFPNMLDIPKLLSLGIKESDSEASIMQKMMSLLDDSNYPCEQLVYIPMACGAKGRDTVDYEAEQMCYCGSTYWDSVSGCNECLRAQGVKGIEGLDIPSVTENKAEMASVSSEYCGATPPPDGGIQGYAAQLAGAAAAGNPNADLVWVENPESMPFFGESEISNYWTEVEVKLGEVTGKAKEAVQTGVPVVVGGGEGSGEGGNGESAAAGMKASLMALLAGLAVGARMVL